jgi:hypothetical protein
VHVFLDEWSGQGPDNYFRRREGHVFRLGCSSIARRVCKSERSALRSDRPTHIAQQFQVEIPRRPIQRQFNVYIGKCPQCHRRVQGRHPLQTSDALGAAAQLGPDAQAAVVELNTQAGLSHGRVTRCLGSAPSGVQ